MGSRSVSGGVTLGARRTHTILEASVMPEGTRLASERAEEGVEGGVEGEGMGDGRGGGEVMSRLMMPGKASSKRGKRARARERRGGAGGRTQTQTSLDHLDGAAAAEEVVVVAAVEEEEEGEREGTLLARLLRPSDLPPSLAFG